MKEGQKIDPVLLTSKWTELLKFLDEVIENGNKVRPIRFLIRHIIENGYDTKLVPGQSHFDLLISVPDNSIINYDKTLEVRYDELMQIARFRYSDKHIKERDSNADAVWEDQCQATEINDLFDHFVEKILDGTV